MRGMMILAATLTLQGCMAHQHYWAQDVERLAAMPDNPYRDLLEMQMRAYQNPWNKEALDRDLETLRQEGLRRDVEMDLLYGPADVRTYSSPYGTIVCETRGSSTYCR